MKATFSVVSILSLPCYVHKPVLYIWVSISIQTAKLLKRVVPAGTGQICRPSLAPVLPLPSPVLLPSVCSTHISLPTQAASDASRSLTNHSPLTHRHTRIRISTTASVQHSPKHYLHLFSSGSSAYTQSQTTSISCLLCCNGLHAGLLCLNLYPAGKITL